MSIVINIFSILVLLMSLSIYVIGPKLLDLSRILSQNGFISLVVAVLVFIFILLFVSYGGWRGVNKLSLKLSLLSVVILVAARFCFIVFKLGTISEEYSSFTNNGSLDVVVSSNVRLDHENNKFKMCLLEGRKYCFWVQESYYKYVYPYSLCNISGHINPKSFERVTNYDLLMNTYHTFNLKKMSCELPHIVVLKFFKVRDFLMDRVYRLIPEPESSLLIGILFGLDLSYSDDFDKAIRSAGLSHIVAASGYNVSILISAINSLLFFVNEKYRNVISLFLIWIYAMLTGFSSSMVRACTMSSILIVSKLFKTKISSFDLFIMTLSLLLFINPLTIFDIGFQLSSCATFGIMFISPIIERWKISKLFSSSTIACLVTTAPVTILNFHSYSIYSIFANTLALPVVEVVMVLGLLGLLVPQIMFLAWGCLKFVEYLCYFIDGLAWSQVQIPEGLTLVFAVSIVVFILILLLKNNKK